jgi:hypothetical protein
MKQSAPYKTTDLCEESAFDSGPIVRHFRQIVLWPLQLMPIREDLPIQKHCDFIQPQGLNNAWREVEDEFTGDPSQFQERQEDIPRIGSLTDTVAIVYRRWNGWPRMVRC